MTIREQQFQRVTTGLFHSFVFRGRQRRAGRFAPRPRRIATCVAPPSGLVAGGQAIATTTLTVALWLNLKSNIDTWIGSDPNGTFRSTALSVGGSSQSNAAGAGFTCTAPGSANQFTVPASVLLALPPAHTGISSDASACAVLQFSFTARLDLGVALTQTSFANSTVTISESSAGGLKI